MNDLYFTAKNKKTGCNFNHFRRKCISSVRKRAYLAFGRVYHQCGALYIIITEFQYTLKRDDIQPKGLMISTTLRAVMICHYSVMDKKRLQFCIKITVFFLAGIDGFEPSRCQSQSLVPYRLAISQYL